MSCAVLVAAVIMGNKNRHTPCFSGIYSSRQRYQPHKRVCEKLNDREVLGPVKTQN